jgi:hypothetical protein
VQLEARQALSQQARIDCFLIRAAVFSPSAADKKPVQWRSTMAIKQLQKNAVPERACTLIRLLDPDQIDAAPSGVTRIAVVVHVVWNKASQNMSDAQIASQISVLNGHYRRSQPDLNHAPAPFLPLAADLRIEFLLADVDPDGAPSSGIERRQTSVSSFCRDDAVKSLAGGGAPAWPADRYLNIWVCQLDNGLLGYAQGPGGPVATDGVVILHSAFGTIGTAMPPLHLGRTATDEIGRWLNLNHLWGGRACYGNSSNDSHGDIVMHEID